MVLTSWTEYVCLAWHIVTLTETKLLSYYPKWKASQNGKNIFPPSGEFQHILLLTLLFT